MVATQRSQAENAAEENKEVVAIMAKQTASVTLPGISEGSGSIKTEIEDEECMELAKKGLGASHTPIYKKK